MAHPESKPRPDPNLGGNNGLREQLAEKVATPESNQGEKERILEEIRILAEQLEKEPEKHASDVEKLRDLEKELRENDYGGETSEGQIEALAETEEELKAIRARVEPPAPKPQEPAGGGESGREAESLNEAKIVGETLDREIERVRGLAASLPDGDEKRRQLEEQIKYLEVYQRVKPGDRNPLWLERVRGVFRHLNRIENPQPARQKREPQAPVKRPAPTESRPVSKPEAPAEVREQKIKERAAQIRAEREAGGAEANVEVDARITAASAQPFTPEADAIAAQWDREQAEKQITEEEAQARLSRPEPPAPEGSGPEKGTEAGAKSEIERRLEGILSKLEPKVGKSPYYEEAGRILPGLEIDKISPQALATAQPILARLEQLASDGWQEGANNQKAWEKELIAKFVELNQLLRLGPTPTTAPAEKGAAVPVLEVQPPPPGAKAAPEARATNEPTAAKAESYEERRQERARRWREDSEVLFKRFGPKFDFNDIDALRAKARELKVEVDDTPGREDVISLTAKIRQALEARQGKSKGPRPTASRIEPPAASEPDKVQNAVEAQATDEEDIARMENEGAGQPQGLGDKDDVPGSGPEAKGEALDPLATDILKMTAEDEEIQEASQAVVDSYNQAVGDENLRREFRKQYHPVRFGAQNAALRLRDASVPPDFKTASNGEFWAVPIEGQPNKFVVFPPLGVNIDQAIVGPGAMAEVYDMPGFDRSQKYKNVQVAKPAVFELDEAAQQWKCIQRGELNLTPGPAPDQVEQPAVVEGQAAVVAAGAGEQAPPPGPAETVTTDPEKARMKERLAAEKEKAINRAALARRAGDDAAWSKASQQYRRISQALKKLQ